MFDKYKIYIIYICIAYILIRMYYKKYRIEPFIVNIGGNNKLILSEDDVGIILSTVFRTPKLTRASFVSILKEIVSIDIQKNYTSITSSQIDTLSAKFPFMANYDLQRQRRIAHFYETDKNVKKFFDENLLESSNASTDGEQVEEFVAQMDEPGNEGVKAVWEKFSQLFGKSDKEQKAARKKREEYLQKSEFKTLIGKLAGYSIESDLSKASSEVKNGKSIGKMFEEFYNIETGFEIEIKDDKIIKKSKPLPMTNDNDDDKFVSEGLRATIQDLVNEAMGRESVQANEEESPYVLDEAGDALSNKLMTYLLNTDKNMREFKTFIRVLVITGRKENNPIPAFKMMIMRGIQESLKYDPTSQEAPEAFRGWK